MDSSSEKNNGSNQASIFEISSELITSLTNLSQKVEESDAEIGEKVQSIINRLASIQGKIPSKEEEKIESHKE